MRRRAHLWLLRVLCAALFFPGTAAADTIRIVSGFLEAAPGVHDFLLVGDQRGFTLSGSVGLDAARFLPNCNDRSECAPGDVARISHVWNGLDFPGVTATLDGRTIENVNSLDARAFAEVGFVNSVVLPGFTRDTAVLRTPFSMEGAFSFDPEGGESVRAALFGSGTMTTTWAQTEAPEGGGRVWALTFARYDFLDAAPVPEPGTLVLAGLAGAAAVFRRRKPRRD